MRQHEEAALLQGDTWARASSRMAVEEQRSTAVHEVHRVQVPAPRESGQLGLEDPQRRDGEAPEAAPVQPPSLEPSLDLADRALRAQFGRLLTLGVDGVFAERDPDEGDQNRVGDRHGRDGRVRQRGRRCAGGGPCARSVQRSEEGACAAERQEEDAREKTWSRVRK